MTVQILRALERKLDGERADKRAGSKGENAGKGALGDRNVKTEHGAEKR